MLASEAMEADNMYEIIDVLVSSGKLSVQTTLAMAQSCKEACKIITEPSRLQGVIKNDHNTPICWFAHIVADVMGLAAPATPDEVLGVCASLMGGNADVLKRLMVDAAMFEDDAKFQTVIVKCFVLDAATSLEEFEKQAVRMRDMFGEILSGLITYCDKHSNPNNASKDCIDVRFKKFAMFIAMTSKIIEFAIRNKGQLLSLPKHLFLNLINLSLIRTILSKARKFGREIFTDMFDPGMKATAYTYLNDSIKLYSAWEEVIWCGMPVGIGPKGGVYRQLHGYKMYYKGIRKPKA